MLHLHDRATMANALTLDLDPELQRLLTERMNALVTSYGDLTQSTEFLIVQAGETEDDIIRQIEFSPLVEPFDGSRYGEAGFWPHWDWLIARVGWYEMCVSFGSSFAYVIFVEKTANPSDELTRLCAEFATPGF